MKNISIILVLVSVQLIACKPELRVDLGKKFDADAYYKSFEDSAAARQAVFENKMITKKFSFACYDFCENNPLVDLNDLNQGKEVPLAVSYQLFKDSLTVKFRFVNDCCAAYVGDYALKGDTLLISFMNNSIYLCDCYCNYFYRFSKSLDGKEYNYLKINKTLFKVDTLSTKMPAIQSILPASVKFNPPQNS